MRIDCADAVHGNATSANTLTASRMCLNIGPSFRVDRRLSHGGPYLRRAQTLDGIDSLVHRDNRDVFAVDRPSSTRPGFVAPGKPGEACGPAATPAMPPSHSPS